MTSIAKTCELACAEIGSGNGHGKDGGFDSDVRNADVGCKSWGSLLGLTIP